MPSVLLLIVAGMISATIAATGATLLQTGSGRLTASACLWLLVPAPFLPWLYVGIKERFDAGPPDGALLFLLVVLAPVAWLSSLIVQIWSARSVVSQRPAGLASPLRFIVLAAAAMQGLTTVLLWVATARLLASD